MVLLYAVGNATPVFRWMLWVVPALSSMEAPSGASFIAIYAISVLAGLALDGIRTVTATTDLRRKLVLAGILVPPILMVAAAAAVWLQGEQFLQEYAGLFYRDLLPGPSGPSGAWPHAVVNLPSLTTGFFIAALTLVVSGLLIWFAYSRRKWCALLWLVPVLVAAASVRFDERFITVCDQGKLFGSSPVTRAISDHGGNWRTLEYDVGEGNLQFAYAGISSPTGRQDRIPLEYFELVGDYSRFNVHNPRFVNLTGTRYLVVSRESHIPPTAFGVKPLDTVLAEGSQILLEDQNCLPRAFLADSLEVNSDRRAILDAVLNGTTDLRRTVLLEEPPTLAIHPSGGTVGAADIVGYDNDSVAIEVHLATNALLILTDNYYSAWHAYVDGKPTKIYRAYGAFRAVEVPAGSTRVLFKYDSPVYNASRDLSLAGLLLVAGLFVFDGWKNRRRRKPGQAPELPPPSPN